MPRSSLPDYCKHVRSMEVLLTKTTVEEIWDHFSKNFENYDKLADEYLEAQYEAIRFLREDDPYGRVNWKSHFYSSTPNRDTRCYKKTTWWLNDDEDNTKNNMYWKMLWLIPADVKRVEELWKDDEEKTSTIAHWLYKADSFRSSVKSNYEELDHYEELAWNTSMQKWKNENKDYIEMKELERAHQHHRTIEEQQRQHDYYMKHDTYYATSSWGQNWKLVDHTLTCILCKKREDEKKEWDIKVAQQEAEQKRKNEEWLAQQQQQKEVVASPPPPRHHCEICDKFFYNKADHEATKGHKDKVKLTELYCSKCDHRSRCKAEHEAHISSKKHRLGDVEKQTVFRCEACDYTANLKQHLDQHNRSKKHLAKINTE